MITFTYAEIALSVIYAMLFGCVFAGVLSIICLLCDLVLKIPKMMKDIIVFEKILPAPSFDFLKSRRKDGGFIAFFSVILFTLGFLLLSYYTLDGIIRIYMLILSFAAFYLAKMTFLNVFERLLLFILTWVLKPFAVSVRLIIYPLKRFISWLKMRKKT